MNAVTRATRQRRTEAPPSSQTRRSDREETSRPHPDLCHPASCPPTWGRNVSWRWFGAAVVAFTVAFTSGCNRSAAENASPTPTAAATYNASRGLRLSEAGATFIAIETAEATAAGSTLRIPASALLRTIKGDFVYVENGEWYLRTPVTVRLPEQPALSVSLAPPATPGAADAITVTEGLYEGDRVVSRGAEALWLAEIHAVNGGVSCAHGH